MGREEFSSCGVGFAANLSGQPTRSIVEKSLLALANLEHRGGCSWDLKASDGAGIMLDIPRKFLGLNETDAVAHLILPRDPTQRIKSIEIFSSTFESLGLDVYKYRKVPIDTSVLSPIAESNRPEFLMAFVRRPAYCTTRFSFDKLLYHAKQLTSSKLKNASVDQIFYASLSAGTLVYKALTQGKDLANFFTDLKDPLCTSRFALFHRRFSTNTSTAWDTAQPFRVIAHNGEINTISGNRAWGYAREKAIGLHQGELLTQKGISDSGSINEMVEALLFRSGIPHTEDILAILMPRASDRDSSYYRFWSRAMEPWDGPALFTYADGRGVGARQDRNGFRPCRWLRTKDEFYLASEAGPFEVPEGDVVEKGSLSGGGSVHVELSTGYLEFRDPSVSRENRTGNFDPRLEALAPGTASEQPQHLGKLGIFSYTEEDFKKILYPMISEAKEGIGSMGDTAALAALSFQSRNFYDYFYQGFAQVTNPPIDYLREKIVTDMRVILGRKPNIFEPKEMIPPKPGIDLESPVLSLAQMNSLRLLEHACVHETPWLTASAFDITFERAGGRAAFEARLEEIKHQARRAIAEKRGIFILSDRAASEERAPIPAIFVVGLLEKSLNEWGLRLRASFVVDSGEIRSSHQVATLIAFGAAAVCPYLALELARFGHASFGQLSFAPEQIDERESKLRTALNSGLQKIISKMGVSVLQSYQGAELFSILGFGAEVHEKFFPGHASKFGGLDIDQLVNQIVRNSRVGRVDEKLPNLFLFREHAKNTEGEKHSFTAPRSRTIHKILAEQDLALDDPKLYQEYLKAQNPTEPVSLRHLFSPLPAETPLETDAIQSRKDILKTFGSGAMSLGAISAEAQRDLFVAMKAVGARSNSGEGGENPFFYSHGICAHTKQIASGRFGVTAEYLVHSQEIQIKIAQGAKPGEGGQLMAPKVNEEIAKARFASPGVDLISPPPMHDIYSIEDLKELIYELKQLSPDSKISVKLVSGENIGTIAVGVAKAGADIVHIAGGDGGTGAATLGSMKHAGLPWELGLMQVHRKLLEQNMRHYVTLRVDGGLCTGRDVIAAALLGAEEFDFGKILLIAQGCIMARVCEKNTCPAGIATQDSKFKTRYGGTPEKIVQLLTFIADDVRRHLATMGAQNLAEITGRGDRWAIAPEHKTFVEEKKFFLETFLENHPIDRAQVSNPFCESVSSLNRLIADSRGHENFSVTPRDRALPATLCGIVAKEKSLTTPTVPAVPTMPLVALNFCGSAGQGFGAFLVSPLRVVLFGEANDSVAKSMSGGKVIVRPSPAAKFTPENNALIGNCALYGATGGTLFVQGIAGDRFAVRNSGATAVAEGIGMHGCEYMTRGTVLVLGQTGPNLGAGMTGGTLYTFAKNVVNLNEDFVSSNPVTSADTEIILALLRDYYDECASSRAKLLLENWEIMQKFFVRIAPTKHGLQIEKLAEELAVTGSLSP